MRACHSRGREQSLWPVLFVLRSEFTMLVTGSNSQEPSTLRRPIKVLDVSPGEIIISQFHASYKGLRREMRNEMKSNLMEILEHDSSNNVLLSRCSELGVPKLVRTAVCGLKEPSTHARVLSREILPARWPSPIPVGARHSGWKADGDKTCVLRVHRERSGISRWKKMAQSPKSTLTRTGLNSRN